MDIDAVNQVETDRSIHGGVEGLYRGGPDISTALTLNSAAAADGKFYLRTKGQI
jgi:hypothetical protein